MRGALMLMLIAGTSACTPPPSPPPPPPPPAVDLGLQSHAGERYAQFIQVSEMERFSPPALGLDSNDQARLNQDMTTSQPAFISQGGGARALVFTGCASTCADGKAIIAFDAADGEAFVGVRDAHGEDVLVDNDRLQALLEATSPTHRWDDPAPAAPAPNVPASTP